MARKSAASAGGGVYNGQSTIKFKIRIFRHQIKTIAQLSHHACFTCEVNGFVQIPAVCRALLPRLVR